MVIFLKLREVHEKECKYINCSNISRHLACAKPGCEGDKRFKLHQHRLLHRYMRSPTCPNAPLFWDLCTVMHPVYSYVYSVQLCVQCAVMRTVYSYACSYLCLCFTAFRALCWSVSSTDNVKPCLGWRAFIPVWATGPRGRDLGSLAGWQIDR